RQAVTSRHVDDGRSNAAQVGAAGYDLDGDAWVIADVLAEAGQGIEQRGLAGVWIADEGDGRRRHAIPRRRRVGRRTCGRKGGSHATGYPRGRRAGRLSRVRSVLPRSGPSPAAAAWQTANPKSPPPPRPRPVAGRPACAGRPWGQSSSRTNTS